MLTHLLPGESLPYTPKGHVPFTGAATSAYAEAYAADVARPVRRRLFEAFWENGLDLNDARVLRALLAADLLKVVDLRAGLALGPRVRRHWWTHLERGVAPRQGLALAVEGGRRTVPTLVVDGQAIIGADAVGLARHAAGESGDSTRGTIEVVSIPPPDRAQEGQRFGPSRSRVLAVLQDLGGPATAAEVAGRLGAHPNTARFHLEALVAAGVVSREREERTTPGRPRTHYVAEVAAPQATQRAATDCSRTSSRRTSPEARSTRLVTPPTPAARSVGSRRRRGAAAVRRRRCGPRRRQLAGMGLESLAAVEGGARIDVTTCLFLEVATQHLDVVCAVHRGLMEGLLEHVGTPVDVESLEPLVGPSHCVARLARRGRRPGATCDGPALSQHARFADVQIAITVPSPPTT